MARTTCFAAASTASVRSRPLRCASWRPRRASQSAAVRMRPPVRMSVGADVAAGFVQVCAGPKPYTEALQEFIRSVVESYRRGYSATALQFEMQAAKGDDTRELQSDEIELRSIYIALVYKTLLVLRLKQFDNTNPVESQPGPFDSFVAQVVEACRQGYSLERIRLQFNLNAEQARNSAESAVLLQGSRIVYDTFQSVQPPRAPSPPPASD